MQVNQVYRAVKYFKMKMDRRRILLKKNIKDSRETQYSFIDEYDDIMRTVE